MKSPKIAIPHLAIEIDIQVTHHVVAMLTHHVKALQNVGE